MTLIELGCLATLLAVPCCAGAFAADEYGGWSVGVPVAAGTFLILLVLMLPPHAREHIAAVRSWWANRRSK